MKTHSKELEDYRKEYRYSKNLANTIKWLGNLSLACFILIIIFMKDIHIKYSILTYYSILCRVTGMMIFKYYEVPEVIHKFAMGDDLRFEIIHENRDEILKRFFKNIYGLGYDRALLNIKKDEFRELVLKLERRDWKKYGRYFSIFYFLMTLLTLWVLSF